MIADLIAAILGAVVVYLAFDRRQRRRADVRRVDLLALIVELRAENDRAEARHTAWVAVTAETRDADVNAAELARWN